MPAEIRKPCTWPRRLTVDRIAELAALPAEKREAEYWFPREIEWIGAAATCSDRKEGAVLVSDAQNAAALALKKQLEGRKLRGRIGWTR